MIFADHATIEEKLRILSDAAKFDVACTSSGVDRAGTQGDLGSAAAAGICHTFSGDGRCISLLKILYTNECIYNCKYCINRASNDVPRATFTPEEVCELTMEFYRRNYIEGLFLSSGIIGTPDHTMEQICKTLHDLRTIHRFNGYIHCKTIPGASSELIEMAGWYADRMSVNMELPTSEGLRELAPNKTRKNILTPMRQIQTGMDESRQALGMKGGNRSAYWYTSKRMGRKTPELLGQRGEPLRALRQDSQQGLSTERADIVNAESDRIDVVDKSGNKNIDNGMENSPNNALNKSMEQKRASAISDILLSNKQGKMELSQWRRQDTSRGFVPAGQSTQMIIGATPESDYEIVSVSEALYQKFDLKRVFYSAFVNVNQDDSLPAVCGQPPLKREHRLYQADWLMRYYGFEARELLTPERPNFNVYLDPKCDWALGHMDQFPVEINTADYNTLLRVPGIGVRSAGRICGARKTGSLDFVTLKKIGVVLKRAAYFITCNGKLMYDFLKIDADYITRQIVGEEKGVLQAHSQSDLQYQQMTLFDFLPGQEGDRAAGREGDSYETYAGISMRG